MTYLMKKVLIIALALLIFLMGCAGAANDPAPAPQPQEEAPQTEPLASLTFATMPALDTFPIFIARDLGFFEDEGLTVHLEQFFSPRDRDIAFQASNDIDGMSFSVVELAIYQEAGVDLVATTSTIGRAGVIAAEGINTIEDLQGQSVALLSGTVMDYILDRALASVGLSMYDVYIYEVPALPTRLEMLLHGQVSAAMLPEPFVTIAQAQGLNVVATTTDLGVNPFILTFRREVTQDRPQELQAFYRAVNRAVDFLNTADREQFIDTLIETVGYPEHLRDILVMPTFPRYAVPEPGVLQGALDFSYSRGLITQQIAAPDIIFDIGS